MDNLNQTVTPTGKDVVGYRVETKPDGSTVVTELRADGTEKKLSGGVP